MSRQDDELPYTLLSRLGRGAYGEVWEAEGPDGRRVAVKRLQVAPAQRARVAREIATLRQLRLPGVVPFVDARIDDDRAWIAMELVRGVPFPGAFGPAHEEAGTPVAWEQLLPRAEALLEVLGRVHAAGFVHRDLKPENILVDADGRPTLLDFGLARASAQGQTITRAGALLGTPRYMSPEQCRGARVDARADLYAVGIMLVEALTGQVPHDGQELHAFMGARARVPAPPLPPGVAPPHVLATLAAVLSLDPSDRPRSASAVLRLLRGEGQRVEPLPRLGARGEIERLRAVLDAGADATVGGPPGSGRDRCLDDTAAAWAGEGRAVVWVPAGTRPYESLRSALGDVPTSTDPASALAGVLATMQAARGLLVVPRFDALDRWSRQLLQRPAPTAGGVRPPVLSACEGDGTVTLVPLAPTEVRGLFGDARAYGDVSEEAAALLVARTGGGAGRVDAEVRRWCTLGLARWEGTRLVVEAADYERLATLPPPVVASTASDDPDRAAMLWVIGTAGDLPREALARTMGIDTWELSLRVEELAADGVVVDGPHGFLARVTETLDPERLDALQRSLAEAFPAGTPRRVRHLLAAGEHGAAWAETARAAEGLLAEGRAAAAVGLLEESFGDDGTGGALDDPWGVARVLARAVWADGSAGVARRAVYLGTLCNLPPDALALLAQAPALAPGVTLAEAEAVPPLDDVVLESLRRDLLVAASRRSGEATVLAEAVVWAEHAGEGPVLARARAWQARQAIEAGDLAAAASYAEAASRHTDDPSLALDQLYVLAEATKLRGDLARAEVLGEELRQRAQALRVPLQEARAEEVVRWVKMRRGDPVPSDPARVAAVRALGRPRLVALAALTEARIALAAGEAALARDLARDAMDAGDAAVAPEEVRLCAAAVLAAAGGSVDLPQLVDAIARLPHPDTRDEATGYLARARLIPSEAP